MKNYIVIVVFLLSGCAWFNLITHGNVDGNQYISKEARFSVIAPSNWNPTLMPPSPNIEPKISEKIIRQHELGYLTKNNSNSYIIIETSWLTWSGKPIIPIDITWDKNGPEKLFTVCQQLHSSEQQRSKDNFSSFTYECFKLGSCSMCLIDRPCLESTKETISIRPGDQIILEKVYILGDEVSPDSINSQPSDAHGWRISFMLISTQSEYEENVMALEEVIGSMKRHS